MTSYMNVPTTQAAAGCGGNNPGGGGGGNGNGNERKRHWDDEGEPSAKRTRGGKLKSLDGRCLHCERHGHQWRFCVRQCVHCHSRSHVATELGVGNGRECSVIRHEHPQWYAALSQGLQDAARAHAEHDEQLNLARGVRDERSYLQGTIRELMVEESSLLWRAQLARQARAAAEARLAAFERCQTAMPPAPRSQAPDRRLAPILEHRLAPSHRLTRNGPYGDDFGYAHAPPNVTFGNGSAPPTGPRSVGRFLARACDEGGGGFGSATRGVYLPR